MIETPNFDFFKAPKTREIPTIKYKNYPNHLSDPSNARIVVWDLQMSLKSKTKLLKLQTKEVLINTTVENENTGKNFFVCIVVLLPTKESRLANFYIFSWEDFSILGSNRKI